MLNSIIYFEENCMVIFEKLENDFLREPTNYAGYVYGITHELYKLGREMIKETLETMDRMLQKSLACRKQW